jgi:hypothetical protein
MYLPDEDWLTFYFSIGNVFFIKGLPPEPY